MQIITNPDLAEYSSIHIGGLGNFLYLPEIENELVELLVQQNNFYIIGGGTNLVFSDSFTADVVSLQKFGSRDFYIDNGIIVAAAGVKLSRIVYEGCRAGIDGFEILAGIPGTLGGAVCMNAGSKYGCIGDYIRSVRVFSQLSKQIEILTREELDFSYRSSKLQDNYQYIVLSAELEFPATIDSEKAVQKVKSIISERITSKIKFPNCGSVFKNPEHEFTVGAMIDRLGLKGFKLGGLGVSEFHGNIIVNYGNGTFADFSNLTELICSKVYAEFRAALEFEIRIL